MCTSPITGRIPNVSKVFRADAPNLELEPQRQLSDASIDSRATDHTERRRGKVGIGVGKLRMIQRIEELGTKLQATFFQGPPKRYGLGEREIQVRLPGTVDDPGCAVPKRGSNAIRPDNWRTRKTGCIEIAIQFRLHRPCLDKLIFRAGAAQLRPVFAYSKNVVGVGICNGKCAAGLNRNNGSNGPPSQSRPLESR